MLKLFHHWPLQYLHTRGVMVLAEGEVSSSALDHLNLGDALLHVGVPITGGILTNRLDDDHHLTHSFLNLP